MMAFRAIATTWASRGRVVDAPVVPTITSANTCAPIMTIAGTGAAMSREDAAAG
jgi:hypothetical protein